MGNIFGMDIRRFSVLFIAVIIILTLVSSFSNYTPSSTNSTTKIEVGTGTQSENYVQPKFSYVYNKTITLAPELYDLEYIRADFANTSPPYYNLSKNAYIFFNFSRTTNSTLQLLLNLLSRNASEITPGAYGALLSIASSAYMNIMKYSNTTLQPFPLNPNDTENYSKSELNVNYAKQFQGPAGFQPGWSYPPSDKITINSPVIEIINKTSVTTKIRISNLQSNIFYIGQDSYYNGVVWVYQFFYGMSVTGNISFYINNKEVQSQVLNVTFGPYGGSCAGNISGSAIVPPGVGKQVYGSYNITTVGAVYGSYRPGAVTIIYCPQGPFISTRGYIFNWYEYNVSVPFTIQVFNGTDPTTTIGNHVYHTRTVNGSFSFSVWSSDPQNFSSKIITYDTIKIANYTINRIWNAGSIEIIPKLNLQKSGNNINYYLTFDVLKNITQPPSWIYQPMIYNRYAAISWFYLEQNASLAHALYEYIMKTISKTDQQFWKFEYFDLAAEYTMYTFNTTYNAFNNLLELESFYENWSVVPAQILNLSAWPSLKYETGQLSLFNVSRIPGIYNSSVYFNVTGDSETYLVDVYNALGYPGWNKVPFGNSFYFGPVGGRTVYFYLNQSGGELPYLGETLNFFDSNYVPSIFYATSGTVYGTPTKIIAIWNGTAWIS